MKMPNRTIPTRLIGGTMLVAATFLSVLPQAFAANPPVDPATHAAHVAAGTMPPDATAAPDMAKGDPALAQQISELQVKMAQLEATLAKSAPAIAPAGAPMPGMPAASPSMGMDKMKSGGQMGNMAPGGGMPAMNAGAMPAPPMAGMGGTAAPAGGAMNMMGMMDKMMGMMDKMMSMPATAPAVGAPMAGGSMPAATAMPPGGMGMDKMEMAGMMGMGTMGGGTGVAMSQSALPGFPGASHLYHIGATDFFLDHPQHIALSTEQTAALNKAKEQARLAKSTADRAIEQAEQELWTLTASDQPDAAKIEAKTRQIEKLTGDARLAFIRAVGDASKLLTDEQRKILTGFAPAAPMAPMKDM